MTARTRSGATGRSLSVDLPSQSQGERLDRILARIVPGQSRAALQRLMRQGRVRLDGRVARPSMAVHGGERIDIEFPAPVPSSLIPENLPLTILHEDADIVVVDKPAGLSVHPGAGSRTGTLVNALLHYCRDLSGVGGVERPGIVHRLDKETSGVLVVAKNDQAHRSLASQFKSRTVQKTYEALVWGRPRGTGDRIEAAIGRHPAARVKMAVLPGGRAARTAYSLVSSWGIVSLLEVRPETGRTHQIRVHLSHVGHPILGDRLYGGRRTAASAGPELRELLASYHGLALHARRLAFVHPRTGEWREFEAPRPPELARLLNGLEALRRDESPRARPMP